MISLVWLVFPVLETTPQRWIQLAEKLPHELFRRKPAPKEWSAYDCLRHIVDTERSWKRYFSDHAVPSPAQGDR